MQGVAIMRDRGHFYEDGTFRSLQNRLVERVINIVAYLVLTFLIIKTHTRCSVLYKYSLYSIYFILYQA